MVFKMAVDQNFEQLKQTLSSAKEVLVLVGQNPTEDTVAGALALYLTCKGIGKNVTVACETPMRVGHSHLVGLDKVARKIGNRNLVVSFEYIQDSIEKVSYHVDGDKFNLVVQPKVGKRPLDPKSVSYSYSGAQAEMVFVLGAISFEGLGSLYQSETKLFSTAHTVSVGKLQTAPFAQTTVVDPKASGVSEVVYGLLMSLGYSAKEDVASNLLAGLDNATKRFSLANVPATTFSAAAELIGNGAKRRVVGLNKAVSGVPPIGQARVGAGVMQPMSELVSARTAPLPEQTDDEQEATDQADKKPPKDWLEPKIFKGATEV